MLKFSEYRSRSQPFRGRHTSSQHHQVPPDDNLSLELLRSKIAPLLIRNSVDAGRQVREHERLHARFLRDAADIFDRRMIDLNARHLIIEMDR